MTQPEGQGFVNYTVRPSESRPTGTRIDAHATIVFDTNDPIERQRIQRTLKQLIYEAMEN